jgi:hypothetical protein
LPEYEACPCWRLADEKLFHPCVEAACLKEGSSTSNCRFGGSAGTIGSVFRCINKIKIRVV